MSGLRGSPNKGKAKYSVTVNAPSKKIAEFQTHVFLPLDIPSFEMLDLKIKKKFGWDAKLSLDGPLRRVC